LEYTKGDNPLLLQQIVIMIKRQLYILYLRTLYHSKTDEFTLNRFPLFERKKIFETKKCQTWSKTLRKLKYGVLVQTLWKLRYGILVQNI